MILTSSEKLQLWWCCRVVSVYRFVTGNAQERILLKVEWKFQCMFNVLLRRVYYKYYII
jgi:hypothetical protein